MNIHQWRTQVRQFNDAMSHNTAVTDEWNRNTAENMHRFNRENSIWSTLDLYDGDKEKAIVLVGASPCLEKDVTKLKELDDNFIIICSNSSLKYLLKHGIKPHYCMCLDSDWIDIPQHLDCDNKDITLLASSSVCAKALDLWKGPIYYQPYYSIDPKLRPKLRKKLGKSVPGGGNSMTQALIVGTIIWNSKTVIMVANEYCFDKNYYADTEAAKQEKLKTLNPCVDVLGRERWTLPALYTYAAWMSKTCGDLSPPGYFIDTSFGLLGKDGSGIHVMELSEAIKQVKWAFETKKELNKIGNKEHILSQLVKQEHSPVIRWNFPNQRERIYQLARS